MAKISIKFLAKVKEAAGTESLEMNVNDGEYLGDLLNRLCQKFGKSLTNMIFEGDSLSENIIIFANGKNILTGEGLKTRLFDGDQLIVLTPVAGG